MKILGANVVSVKSGTMTLKEAVDEAFIAYSKNMKQLFMQSVQLLDLTHFQ